MTTVDEIKSELEDVKNIVLNVSGDVDSLITQVALLKQQIAEGGVATQADLDAIGQAALDIKTSLAGVDAKEPSA